MWKVYVWFSDRTWKEGPFLLPLLKYLWMAMSEHWQEVADLSIQVLPWRKEENLISVLGSNGWVADREFSRRRDQTHGPVRLGWPPALRWQVRAGVRGEREVRRAAPGRRYRRRTSCSPLLPQRRPPPAGGRRPGTPPAPCGTAPGGAGGTAAEPPADEPPCCHLPPHSPPLPPHRPEVTRQGSDSAGTLQVQIHTYTHLTNSGTILTPLTYK